MGLVNMDTKKTLLIVAIAVALSGCRGFGGEPKQVQATMTLEEAICRLQDALIETKRPKDKQAGLKVGEATAELSLGLKSTGSVETGAKLKLGIVEWGPKASYSRERTSGNKISVKFVPSEDGPYLWKLTGADGKPLEGPIVASVVGPDGKSVMAELEVKKDQPAENAAPTANTDYCAQFAE